MDVIKALVSALSSLVCDKFVEETALSQQKGVQNGGRTVSTDIRDISMKVKRKKNHVHKINVQLRYHEK